MSLAILPPELAKISEHARRDYPHECCGFLLGKESNGWKLVAEARPVANARSDSPRNRFLITPEDYLAGLRYAREQKLDILGFYHSHPDHPARPSEFDREHAWPWFSYVIVSVRQGTPREITSWALAVDDLQFHREEMAVTVQTLEEMEHHAR